METQPTQEILESTAPLAAITRGEIDAQVATAKEYPRTISRCIDDATALATVNTAAAEQCRYGIKRAGKTITGPSIRLAEILAHTWGNNRVAARIIGFDEAGRNIIAEAVFHDLEKNTAVSRQVSRRCVDKQGRRYSDDMLGTTTNAATAIAMRNAIVAGIPRAVWQVVDDAVVQTIAGDAETFATRRNNMLDWFAKHSIDERQVLAAVLRRSVTDITPDDFVQLKALAVGVEAGDADTLDMLRPPKPKQTGPERAREAVSGPLPVEQQIDEMFDGPNQPEPVDVPA